MITVTIPHYILNRNDLLPQYKLIYGVLFSYGANKVPLKILQTEIAEMTGTDRRMVQRAFKKMYQLGLVEKVGYWTYQII